MKDKPALATTLLPPEKWLVAVHDPADDLVAVLLGKDAGGLLLSTDSTGSPSCMLQSSGITAAFVSGLGTDAPTVTPLGAPAPNVLLRCSTCRAEFELSAADLRDAKRRRSPGRAARLAIGVAHSAVARERAP